MVIDDLNIKSIAILEAKAQAPLVIDANTPLTFAASAQSLQPVARRNAKVLECIRVIEHLQLAFRNDGNRPEPAGALALKQRLRMLAAKALDHTEMI
jgi:hypothetical protein